MDKIRKSLMFRLWGGLSLFFVAAVSFSYWIASAQFSASLLLLLFLSILVCLGLWLRKLLDPLSKLNQALADGIGALSDGDYSISLHDQAYLESSHLVQSYNQLTSKLRAERLSINQRELLLNKVIQNAPLAMVLTNGKQVVHANLAARELFQRQYRLEGELFEDLIQHLPSQLAAVTCDFEDGLVSYSENDQAFVYQFQCQTFYLHGKSHYLYLYQNLSSAISRKEQEMWKRLIRLISHELNNSLAPIQSLTKSAKAILTQPEHMHMLSGIMDTISSRSHHLHKFIAQYIEYAKLPIPNVQQVDLPEFYQRMAMLLDVKSECDCAADVANFDPIQIEQVLVNLVKNAKESGSELSQVGFEIKQVGQNISFVVYDRGQGMNNAQLAQAFLPFYTTKPKGTGIGLTLANEIVVAHQGKLRLFNRDHGGLCVSLTLPI